MLLACSRRRHDGTAWSQEETPLLQKKCTRSDGLEARKRVQAVGVVRNWGPFFVSVFFFPKKLGMKGLKKGSEYVREWNCA